MFILLSSPQMELVEVPSSWLPFPVPVSEHWRQSVFPGRPVSASCSCAISLLLSSFGFFIGWESVEEPNVGCEHAHCCREAAVWRRCCGHTSNAYIHMICRHMYLFIIHMYLPPPMCPPAYLTTKQFLRVTVSAPSPHATEVASALSPFSVSSFPLQP